MKKYKIIFWVGFVVLCLQIVLYFVCRLAGGNISEEVATFNWSPELLLPAPLMMLIGVIGVCSYHKPEDTKEADKNE